MDNTSFKITLNDSGNYELSEYNSQYNKQITLEFLGTADQERLSQEIQQTLKNQYLRKIFKENGE